MNLKIETLLGILRQSIQQHESFRGKSCYVFLGNTGAGKSTTVNYALGHEIVQELLENGKKAVCTGPEDKIARIGHSFTSETMFPRAYEHGELILLDTPGYLETRGIEEELAINISNRIALREINILGIVIVIDYPSLAADKGSSFREIVASISNLFKNIRAIKSSVLFVISKIKSKEIDEDKKEEIVGLLREILKSEERKLLFQLKEKKSSELTSKCCDFLRIILEDHSKIYLIDVFDTVRRLEFQQSIKKLRKIGKNLLSTGESEKLKSLKIEAVAYAEKFVSLFSEISVTRKQLNELENHLNIKNKQFSELEWERNNIEETGEYKSLKLKIQKLDEEICEIENSQNETEKLLALAEERRNSLSGSQELFENGSYSGRVSIFSSFSFTYNGDPFHSKSITVEDPVIYKTINENRDLGQLYINFKSITVFSKAWNVKLYKYRNDPNAVKECLELSRKISAYKRTIENYISKVQDAQAMKKNFQIEKDLLQPTIEMRYRDLNKEIASLLPRISPFQERLKNIPYENEKLLQMIPDWIDICYLSSFNDLIFYRLENYFFENIDLLDSLKLRKPTYLGLRESLKNFEKIDFEWDKVPKWVKLYFLILIFPILPLFVFR